MVEILTPQRRAMRTIIKMGIDIIMPAGMSMTRDNINEPKRKRPDSSRCSSRVDFSSRKVNSRAMM